MNINNYLHKTIIAWHALDDYEGASQGNITIIYPQLIRDNDGNYSPILNEDFPTSGRIQIRVQNDQTAGDLINNAGNIVEVTLNEYPSEKPNGRDQYYAKYSQLLGRISSQVWIEPISSRRYIQVVRYSGEMEHVSEIHTISLQSLVDHYSIITNEIMVECNDKYWGPFNYEIKGDNLLLSSKVENQYYIAAYAPSDLPKAPIQITDPSFGGFVKFVVSDIIPAPIDLDTKIDWIPDERLIEYFLRTLKSNDTYTKEQLRELKISIQAMMSTSSGFEMTTERVSRLEQIVGSLFESKDALTQICNYILNSADLGNTLIQTIFEDYFDVVEKRSKEFSTYKGHIEDMQSTVKVLETTIESMKADKQALADTVKYEQHQQIGNIQLEIVELEQKRDALADVICIGDDMVLLQQKKASLEQQAENARRIYDHEKSQVDAIKKQLDDAIARFRDDADVIKGKIGPILDKEILNRVTKAICGFENSDSVELHFSEQRLTEISSDKQLIFRIAQYLREKAGRFVSDNDIANYLICISQGFITTFAGNPGTGKTSLCNLLAKALGLAGADGDRRYVEVSVERGWTSHKDFIGYYNPLTKEMEKSNVDVYNSLQMLDEEFSSVESAPPFIFLLDEANLSPIEHYWAAFLRNCDFDSSTERSINLGGNKVFKLPDNLRFLATVNFDHTTEDLSPRYIDRSWIVMLAPSQISEDTLSDEDIPNAESTVSYSSLISAFIPRKDDRISEVIMDKWNKIQAIFQSCSQQIMPRNLKMVRNYCMVACRCMEQGNPETRFDPLDFAVAQKILPLINGTGAQYDKLISALLDECVNMRQCKSHLDRMKLVAENNNGYYQFFAR